MYVWLLFFFISLVDQDLVIKHLFVHFRFHLPALTLLLILLVEFSMHEALFGVTGLLMVEQHLGSPSINIQTYFIQTLSKLAQGKQKIMIFHQNIMLLSLSLNIAFGFFLFFYIFFIYFVNNINMILDAILLILTLLSLHIIKSNYPNFLFLPHGAALFLPPQDTPQNRPKKKKQQTQNQVSVLKVQFQHVKDYPFSNEFSRVLLTTTGLTIFFILRLIISFFYNGDSLLPFYTACLLLVYTGKLGVDTFFMTNYGRKNCLLVALGINAIFLVFFQVLGNTQGVFDQNLKIITQDWLKHLEIIFNRRIDFITHKTLLYLVFIINFFLIIIAIPSVIKFGNWYAKTLKQIYYDSQAEQNALPAARKAGQQQADVKDQQKRLKQQSKKIILKLNVYLTSTLFLLFLSHPYICQYLDQRIVFGLRAVCLIACVLSVCLTMNSAIEFNGSFAYRYVLQFFQTDDTQKRAQLRKRIAPYIYYIWYHLFQLIIRIIIPVLIFLIVFNWRYIAHDKEIIPIGTERSFNPDIECSIGSTQLEQLSNLYRCGMASHQGLKQNLNLNGILWSIPQTLDSARVQSNIQKYGLITTSIMVQFWQQLFWYSSISIYLMTVSYILLLRKTVYDI